MALPLAAIGLGASVGKGLMGLFGGGAPSFNIQTGAAEDKIKRMSDFGQSDITGPSQAGQLSLDELDRQRGIALNQAGQAGQTAQASALSQLGIFGGAGGGSGERATRNTLNQQAVSDQQLRSDFAGQRSGLLSGDLGNEQKRRDDANRQALSGELGILESKTSAELARVGQAAQRKASQGGIFGSLLGAGAGYLLGSK